MSALFRYQAGVLLRSHRWVGPLVVYAIFVWFSTAAGPGSELLSSGLSWSAGVLVPVVAWLTRSMLTAEPAEARACAAAAGGPHRAHLAALTAALAGGAVLGLVGTICELLTCQPPKGGFSAYASTVATGLAATVICISVGSAVGTLCNPPIIRAAAIAILSTTGAVIAAVVMSISPANAAIKDAAAAPRAAAAWPVGPLLAAVILLVAVTWAISALFAARRGP
jgi:hypothetical protein